MLDQLRQIAIFAKTIDHGSFRGAARELRLSPSVVSHHISQLEDHIGVALIHRSTRKLALTREGERLLDSAHKMLAVVGDGLSDISDAIGQKNGEIRVTLPSVLSQTVVTKSFGRFSKLYPGVKLTLNFTDAREGLIEGGLDVAIRMGSGNRHAATTRKLFQTERTLVASKSYLDKKPIPVIPEDVLGWDWLALSQVYHLKYAFKKTGEKPVSLKIESRIKVNDVRALYHLARTGAGIAIVPDLLAHSDFKEGKIEAVLPDWILDPLEVFIEWPPNAPRNGLIRLFVDWLSDDLDKTFKR